MNIDVEYIIDQLDQLPKNHSISVGDLKILLINAMDRQTDAENRYQQQIDESMSIIGHDM